MRKVHKNFLLIKSFWQLKITFSMVFGVKFFFFFFCFAKQSTHLMWITFANLIRQADRKLTELLSLEDTVNTDSFMQEKKRWFYCIWSEYCFEKFSTDVSEKAVVWEKQLGSEWRGKEGEKRQEKTG